MASQSNKPSFDFPIESHVWIRTPTSELVSQHANRYTELSFIPERIIAIVILKQWFRDIII